MAVGRGITLKAALEIPRSYDTRVEVSPASGRKLCVLKENNYRLLALDLLGCGGTDPWHGPGELTQDAQAALVRGLILMAVAGISHPNGTNYPQVES